jgi:hypothetical protein
MVNCNIRLLSIVGPRLLGEPDDVHTSHSRFYKNFTNQPQVDFAFTKINKLVSSLDAREKKLNPDWCLYDHLRIISGGAQGADELGRLWAVKNQIHFTCFPAQWNRHNKAAGFIRNKVIADSSDYILAFWDGESKGTAHTISLVKKLKASKLKVVRYEEIVPYN